MSRPLFHPPPRDTRRLQRAFWRGAKKGRRGARAPRKKPALRGGREDISGPFVPCLTNGSELLESPMVVLRFRQ
jgi:hypothetical protein